MRIGYSILGEADECRRLEEDGQCERIEVSRETPHTLTDLLAFLERNRTSTIVVVNVESLNVSISQYDKIKQALTDTECDLHFLEKDLPDDALYVRVLAEVGKRDARMMSSRTHKGLEKARENGKIGGRPTIHPNLIARIQVMHQVHRKTIREISNECGVSLGTVHKYITKMEESVE